MTTENTTAIAPAQQATTAIRNRAAVTPDDWRVMREQAAVMLKSGFLPPSIKTPEQAMTIMLTGHELGIGPMESTRGINVIEGKPAVSPQLMLALSRRTRELEDIRFDESATECRVIVKRRGQSPITTKFGDAEAKALGLISKRNYVQQKSNMFRWRALAANLRLTFPDAVSGLYTADELGADVTVDDSGHETILDTKQKPAARREREAEATATIVQPQQVINDQFIDADERAAIIEEGMSAEERSDAPAPTPPFEVAPPEPAPESERRDGVKSSGKNLFIKTKSGKFYIKEGHDTAGVDCPHCANPLGELRVRSHGGKSVKCSSCGNWIGEWKAKPKDEPNDTATALPQTDDRRELVNLLNEAMSKYDIKPSGILSLCGHVSGGKAFQVASLTDDQLASLIENIHVKHSAKAEAQS